MLTTRKINFDKDSAQIVHLLKSEFGNRFTEEFFTWKHLKNPFGISYGIVAVNEKEEVIGVRLFMWWEFEINKEKKIAIRPVDTTTHKDYRGMGVFKNLTLTGIKELEGKYDFIFNTPNNNSLPGYLKMGWKKLDQNLNYYLNFSNPFGKKHKFKNLTLSEEWPDFNQNNNINSTVKSIAFLQWRYEDNDYKKACFIDQGKKDLIIYRMLPKKLKGITLNMIIVIDYIGNSNKLKPLINSVCHYEKSFCYYFLDHGNTAQLKNKLSFKRGDSVVAFRSAEKLDTKSISFSTGDLEGIL